MKNSYISKKPSFTMIELLIVCGLIVFMAGMLLSGIGGVFEKNNKARTKETIMKLDIAIRGFRKKEGRFPFDHSWVGGTMIANDDADTTISANLAKLEEYEEVLIKDSNDDWAVLDSFEVDGHGKPLWIILSYDYTNSDNSSPSMNFDPSIDEKPQAKKVSLVDQYYQPDSFQIISAGPDGDYDTETDNVYNFDVY